MKLSLLKRRSLMIAGACLLLGMMPLSSQATITFSFNGTTVGGNAADASVDFSISGDTMTVTLTDLYQNPASVANVLNGVTFNLSGVTSASSLTADQVNIATIAKGGSYTPSSYTDLASQWTLSGSGSSISLAAFPNANYLILGPDASGDFTYDGTTSDGYTAANNSIAPNNPNDKSHNPFVLGNATFKFQLNGSGNYSESDITNVVFGFGTSTDTSVVPPSTSVPEPSTIVAGTLLLLPFGISTMRILRKKRSA